MDQWQFPSGKIVLFPAVMGVLNCTPDSFSDGAAYQTPSLAVEHALRMVAQGAAIIDIGGESTRPGAPPVTAEEEWARIAPVLHGLRKESDILISVDTSKPEIMARAEQSGADLINDVSAFSSAPAIDFMKRSNLHGIAMHMQGTPATMQDNPRYRDVVAEVCSFLQEKTEALLQAGVARHRLCIDPGIGFGKTLDHNLTLLTTLSRFTQLSYPLCIGISRKSVNQKLLGFSSSIPLERRLPASLLLTQVALANGAHIVRTHDVSVTADWLMAIQNFSKWQSKQL